MLLRERAYLNTLLIAAACVPVAWLLYRFVEDPARSAGFLARARPRRTLWLSLAGSVASVAVASTALLTSTTTPLSTNQPVAEQALTNPPTLTPFVPSNLEPSLSAAFADQADIYADGCHLEFEATTPADCLYGDESAERIVLFGDSHAAQWFPAVRAYAESRGLALESHTKSSCPSIDGPILLDAVPYTACAQWRTAVIRDLNESPPSLVIITNRGGSAGFDPGNVSREEAWDAALTRTLQSIDAPTIVLADTPDLGFTPSVCLSAHIKDTSECDVPRETALARTMNSTEADVAARFDVPIIDLNDYLCDATCGPVIGNLLVYRDGNHMTATFSESLGVRLSEALAELPLPLS